MPKPSFCRQEEQTYYKEESDKKSKYSENNEIKNKQMTDDEMKILNIQLLSEDKYLQNFVMSLSAK